MKRILMILLTVCVLLAVVPALRAQPTSQLGRAWRLAEQIGHYRFATTIVQTTTPLPRLINAGLSQTVERLYVEGSADRPADTIALKLWSQGGSTLLDSGALEMRIVGGVAQGRVGDGPWQTVDDLSALIAPGRDPLGFMNAATNIIELGRDAAAGTAYTRYGFTIDGPAYARFMRDQTVEQLRARGDLPPGVQLGPSRGLAQITGQGEIWLDEDGLPLRQVIAITLPEQGLEQVSADITTDFSSWGELSAQTSLRELLSRRAHDVQAAIAQQVGNFVLLGAALLIVLPIALYGDDRRVYRAVSAAFVGAVVLIPLLQVRRAQAIGAALDTLSASGQIEATAPADLGPTLALSPVAAPQAPRTAGRSGGTFFDDGTDGDGDGISDAWELNVFNTLPDRADSDGDGLTDDAELLELGTNPRSADSDGDGLHDRNEVNGFLAPNGARWYLDPTLIDTNGDGEPDNFGCAMQGVELNCSDGDGDGVPNVFDRDDDNDGVPDGVDKASTGYFGDRVNGFPGGVFEFDLNGLVANQSVFVDVQLRPINPEHLWYGLSVLDWPSDDRAGQVRRVHDDPFDASGRNANGDMQLSPVLEVRMSGTPLPLPLTTPVATVAAAAGTLTLTQTGADIALAFALGGSDTYNAEIIDAACGAIDAGSNVLYTFTGVGNGSSALLAGQSLVQQIATGTRALRLTNTTSGEQSCTTIPNVINGAYTDQMVDTDLLSDYRITVRELDTAGTVYMLAPLTLVYEQAENMPVAFGTRLFYKPGSADFGSVQSVRLLWTIAVKEDRCLPMPVDFDPNPATTGEDDETAAQKQSAWCGDDANWVGIGATITQTYYDNWYLTGLKVQRNLGFNVAAVFQDPAYTVAQPDYTPGGFGEADLWMLARGLDVSYIAARSRNNTGRDLNLDVVQARWDKRSNAGVGDTQRFGLSADAFFVERFDYADESGLGYLSQRDIYATLETTFTPYVGNGVTDPTVLYLQESRIRAMTTDQTDLVQQVGNRLTLDVSNAQLPELLLATLNWTPYRWQGDGWRPYDLQSYWVDKGDDIKALLGTVFPSATPDRQAEIDGAAFLANVFYLHLVQGTTRTLEIDGVPTDMRWQISDDQMAQYLYPNADPDLPAGELVTWLLSDILSGVFYLAGDQEWSLGAGLLTFERKWTDLTPVLLDENVRALSEPDFRPSFAQLTNAERVDAFNDLVKLRRTSENLTVGAAVLGTAAVAASLIGALVSLTDSAAGEVFVHVSAALGVVTATLTLASNIVEAQVQLATKALKTLVKSIEITKAAYVFLAVGIAIGLGAFIYEAVAAGLKAGSLDLNQLFFDFLADVIVAVLLFAISAIPVIGVLIAAVIALIDAVISFICNLVPEENDSEAGAKARDYLCDGISGLLSKVVAWLFYDQNPLVDLTRGDRLNVTNIDYQLVNPDVGYRAGNRLRVQADIETALYAPVYTIEDFSIFNVYRWMFNDTTLKKTTLAYQFAEEAAADRAVGDMVDQWQPLPNPLPDNFFAPEADFYTVIALDRELATPLEAGINSTAAGSLVERQYYLVQECTIGPTCWTRRESGEVPINLSSYFTFDIFPASLAGFRELAQPEIGRYQLAWDPQFPILKDADGDGLRNALYGGSDPNDGDPDSDNDRLSDYYEQLVTGTDPLRADTDGDGLCDDQELQFGADPLRADSDGDGLLDSDEVFHQDLCDGDGDGDTAEWVGGRLFTYGYGGATPLRTLVTSDPNSADGDGDLYPDALEKLYGFNPRVPSSGDILNIRSTVSNPIVRPGGAIDYRVELENALDTSFALGLLDVTVSDGVQASTVRPAPFNLRPQQTEESIGRVTLRSDIATSRIVTLTNSAGASILNPLTEVGGRSLWLRFAEDAGATSFLDSSLNAFTFTCGSLNCPFSGVAGYRGNGLRPRSNLPGNSGIVGASSAPVGVTSAGFSADIWFKIDATTGGNIQTLLQLGGLTLYVSGQQALGVVGGGLALQTPNFSVPFGRWLRASLTHQSGSTKLFLDGSLMGSSSADIAPLLAANVATPIGVGAFATGSTFTVDEVSIYPFALADSQVDALANERVFYLSGQSAPVGNGVAIVDDSPFRTQSPATKTAPVHAPTRLPTATSTVVSTLSAMIMTMACSKSGRRRRLISAATGGASPLPSGSTRPSTATMEQAGCWATRAIPASPRFRSTRRGAAARRSRVSPSRCRSSRRPIVIVALAGPGRCPPAAIGSRLSSVLTVRASAPLSTASWRRATILWTSAPPHAPIVTACSRAHRRSSFSAARASG